MNIVSGGCARDDLVSGSLDMTWSVVCGCQAIRRSEPQSEPESSS